MQPALPDNKKLTVVYRIEPGCLGPAGKDQVEAFCEYANQELLSPDAGFVNWQIVPRYDKSLPEIQYLIAGKKLDAEKSGKYLDLFDRKPDEFEDRLHERMSVLIEQYLDR